MQPGSKDKRLIRYLSTEKGSTIRITENEARTEHLRHRHSRQRGSKQFINRRVITETSEKCYTESIKKLKKQFKLPFQSVSPKSKIPANSKSSITNLKKKSKIKSIKKFKGLTETGPIIKKSAACELKKHTRETCKHYGQQDKNDDKHKKSYLKLKSPCSKKLIKDTSKKNIMTNLSSNEYKRNIGHKKSYLKTQGSFDSTSSCLFYNQVDIIGLIGQGTFGQVFKGRLKQTGEIVAIKRVLQDKKYKNRQIQMVNMLNSDFIMRVLGTYITCQEKKQYLNIIMTHYDCDLYYYIKQHDKKGISNYDIKLITYQAFRGLLYIHSRGICHRDIKPHNILLKGKNTAICDFGSAKILKPGEPNLPYICSRCYRAPQLIFGATQYTTMIDIWSMGCVILEMLNKVPLFIGESSIDHLIQVIKVMGTPTKTQVVHMNPDYDLNDYKFPKIKKKQWHKIFPKADPMLIDLIEQTMLYSPKQRLTAAQALAHEYYDQIRCEDNYSKLVKLTGIEHFFNFNEQQITGNQHLLPKLIPQWYTL